MARKGSGEAGRGKGAGKEEGGRQESVPSGLRLSAAWVARSNLSQHISNCSFTDRQYSIKHKQGLLSFIKERYLKELIERDG